MKVKVVLKEPAQNGMKEFEFLESAILDDKEAGWAVLSFGSLGLTPVRFSYLFKDSKHIVYNWDDIDRIEIKGDD